MTWPLHHLIPQQTLRHQNTWLQSTRHHHRGTAESLCTAKEWFGHGAGRSPCAHSIGKFFLCYILFFLLKLPPPARPGTTCMIQYVCSFFRFNEEIFQRGYEWEYCIRLTFEGISKSLKREGQQGLLEEHTWEGCKFLDPKFGSCRWCLHVQSSFLLTWYREPLWLAVEKSWSHSPSGGATR